MPRSLLDWYSLYELEALGQREAQLSGEIDLKRLTRLREMLHTDDGSVRASFRFSQRSAGYTTIDLEYEATLTLTCQRCLEPVTEKASEHVSLVVIEDGLTEAGAPAGYDPIALTGGKLQPAAVVEDELIVSVPIVPRHTRVEECGVLAENLDTLKEESKARPTDPPLRSH